GAALSSPTVWLPGLVLLLAYPAAGYLLQHGFVSGAPEVVIGGLTVVDPIVAVLIGAFLLGEGSLLAPSVLVVMLACAVVAVAGIVVLSRHHPDAQRARQERPAAVAGPVGEHSPYDPGPHDPNPHDSSVETERNTR